MQILLNPNNLFFVSDVKFYNIDHNYVRTNQMCFPRKFCISCWSSLPWCMYGYCVSDHIGLCMYRFLYLIHDTWKLHISCTQLLCKLLFHRNTTTLLLTWHQTSDAIECFREPAEELLLITILLVLSVA